MSYSTSHIAAVTGNDAAIRNDSIIEHILLDSRRIIDPVTSLFFALKGPRRDGHQFIVELYKKGVKNFVVSDESYADTFADANFIFCDDTLETLQQLVVHHRARFNYPVIGITGSNGKTIVKEWLYQLLHENFNIIRSPKSYNSQIGVPLSVWQMNEQHTLGIFEAGISESGEMFRLQKMIKPTIGVLTNIGEAHSEGFNDAEHKFREKISLFKSCKVIIGREIDLEAGREVIEMMGDQIKLVTWGYTETSNVIIKGTDKIGNATFIHLLSGNRNFTIEIPFTDEASVENAITCCCVLLHLEMDTEMIAAGMKNIHPVNMRLELKKGINHCTIINDSYSADLSSLEIALNFLDQQSSNERKTVILSDFLQSSLPDEELYEQVMESLEKHRVTRLIGIGERISTQLMHLTAAAAEKKINVEFYSSTKDYINHFRSSHFKEETILVKGARSFAFEKIVQLFEQKAHQTVLEINLNAIVHNLRQYQKLLKPSTKVMAMVKAFAYGSGGAEIAGILQFHKVDYLGVAYADEGVELRKAGITLPIMVMNPEENAFEAIAEYNLEPEIYSFELLHSFDRFLQQEGLLHYPVHIEIETGMNRLGFSNAQIEKLGDELQKTSSFKIQSIFSHLAASEDPAQDEFTFMQWEKLSIAVVSLEKKIGYTVLKHIANSAAIVRHPALELDMVRLGIGLYGVDSADTNKLNLQTVTTLRSTIAQIKHLKAGDSVSYNRKTIVNKDSVIATIRIGYADGYPRRLGNGIGKIGVKDCWVPVAGTVCMDMIMVDITGIDDVQEGDDVVIFGGSLPVQKIAEWAGTIPYEIMTGISQRVKRVYYEE
ncbi:MAG: bifunctional UDP-N-acetylmuramoyl-tripeptide:D-alanyl-D-alanine ligase/alanine racemase [Chitinophagaceae bacterium]|nr:bifunctional UDP-N-acetylmuramoyl-tripeptide:D-alanyl-D-alanine ligase/alanine racemase [Chitinophagaceae bacterium]